jgi:hypothetical protein
LYPHPHWGKEYQKKFDATVEMEDFDSTITNWPDPILVAVPATSIVVNQSNVLANTPTCSQKKQWDETISEIEENIENYFPPVRWQKIKNLAKEILRNPAFCVKTDGKTFHLKERPRTEVSMIDFLAVATRRAAPMERQRDPIWKLYSMHVDTLLKNNAPKDLFKNKLLLPKKMQ